MNGLLFPLALAAFVSSIEAIPRPYPLAVGPALSIGLAYGSWPFALALAILAVVIVLIATRLMTSLRRHRVRVHFTIALEEAIDAATLRANPWAAVRDALSRSKDPELRAMAADLGPQPRAWAVVLEGHATRLALPSLRQLGQAMALVATRGSDVVATLTLFVSDLHQAERARIQERALQTSSLITAAALAGLTIIGVFLESVLAPVDFRVLLTSSGGVVLAVALLAVALGAWLPIAFSEIPT